MGIDGDRRDRNSWAARIGVGAAAIVGVPVAAFRPLEGPWIGCEACAIPKPAVDLPAILILPRYRRV